jgi:hypothetical protein
VCALCTWLCELKEEDRKPAFLFIAAGFISSILYLIQLKGFYYHLIPTLIFTSCGCGMLLYGLFGKFIKRESITTLIAVFLLTGLPALACPPEFHATTHAQYKQLGLSKLVDGCTPDCSFFVFGENMEMIHQVTVYTGAQHASRYAFLWWLKPLVMMQKKGGAQAAEAKERLDRHTALMIADFHRYKPEVLAIDNHLRLLKDGTFNFMEFFSQYPGFQEEMKHYRKDGQLRDNRRDYFRDTPLDFDHFTTYDIYRRVD